MTPTQEVQRFPIREIVNVVDQIKEKIKNPAIPKQFTKNVNLLMGQNDLTIGKLATLAGCNPTTLYRLLKGRGKVESTNIRIFSRLASTLGVSINTLLFVDLNKKLAELIYMIENQRGFNRLHI